MPEKRSWLQEYTVPMAKTLSQMLEEPCIPGEWWDCENLGNLSHLLVRDSIVHQARKQ
jgi:hypothetical protein